MKNEKPKTETTEKSSNQGVASKAQEGLSSTQAPTSKKKKISKLKIALIIMSAILIITISVPIIYINIILDRIDYVPADEDQHTIYEEGEITFEVDVEETPLPSGVEPTLHPDEPDPSKPPQYNEKVPENKDIINVLLIGVEKSRPTENGRSDTMMIATFDKKNKELKLTSILRDNYVYIPGNYLNNRINAAHSFGNVPLLLKTINTNFNLKLEKYVSVDFEMFIKVMERLGNVEMYLTDKEAERVFGKGHGAGTYTLDPEHALKYTRLRKIDSDFMRTQRQRNLLIALYNKFIDTNIFTLLDVMYDVLPYVKTNLSKNEIIGLMTDVFSMGKKEIKELRIPVQGTYKNATIRGMLVLVPDIKANAEAIRKFIYG